jgi:hypothetical protein
MSCSNNLKQLGLAAANYESANGRLPPGVLFDERSAPFDPKTGNLTNNSSFTGCLVFLLPYAEQDNAFRQVNPAVLDLNQSPGGWWNFNFAIAQTHVKTFECPSDNLYANSTNTFALFTCYQSALYGDAFPAGSVGDRLGGTNYIANAGFIGDTPDPGGQRFRGPYYADSKTKSVDITDGTSNTIAFGETLGGTFPGVRGSRISWFGAGTMPTGYGLGEPPQWYTFGSKHAGVVQFVYCDGSVRGVRKGADFANYVFASGAADGVIVDFSQLGG